MYYQILQLIEDEGERRKQIQSMSLTEGEGGNIHWHRICLL
jgi:hypothetical protein